MVAIIAGTGLGLERSSAWVLGSRGQLGQAQLGRVGDNVYVNAANGNLVVQKTDEILIGTGPDDTIARTFNSGSGAWQLSGQRKVSGLTGTVNTSGSTVTHYGWDGSDVVYAYDTGLGKYVAKEGEGAYDTLSFSGSTWTWTDGSSRVVELYDNANGGRLTSSTDADGNALGYTYNGSGQVSRVTTQNGEYTDFTYSSGNLTQLVTSRHADATGSASLTTLTRVRYGYDGSNRLTSVTVDLSPDDSSVSDGKTFTTTYAYDGSSTRVASITGSDGSAVAIAYTLVGGAYWVASLAQTTSTGVTQTTSFSYDAANRITTVTDPLGQATALAYDAAGQLLSVTAPPAVSGATAQVTQFTYDAKGNVLTVTSPNGAVVTYGYDASGNRTSEVDSLGNTVTRTFGSKNELLTETRYLIPDPDGAGSGVASDPITTRYAYDSENHLRFVIGAEGDVVEHRYNAAGQETSVIAYAGFTYSLTGLSSTTAPSESTLASWVTGLSTRAGTNRTDISYDFRGNIATTTAFGLVQSSGAGDTSAATEITTTTYIYDQAGNLISRQPAIAGAPEVFVYDGLGRLVSSTDLAGATTTLAFNDAASETVVTLANGLTQTSTYDLAGRLIAFSEAGSGVTTSSTTYAYDALGRLRMVTDPTGSKTYSLYDAVGRKTADIAADGALIEYGYTADSQLATTIRYANKLSGTQLASLVASGAPANVTLASVRPSADAADRHSWAIYDDAGRLIETIDPTGAAVAYAYDGASRRISATAYATLIDATTLAGLVATAPTAVVLPTASAGADRVSRSFYDNDGRLVATLDAEGYLTRTRYDGAGQAVETIASATAAASGLRAAGTLAQLITSVGTASADIHHWALYDSRGLIRAAIDGEGNLTRYHYTALGGVDQVISGQVLNPATLISTPPTLAGLPAAGGAVILDTTAYARDLLGRVLTETKSLASGGTEVTTYVYDAMGALVKTTQAYGTSDARIHRQRFDLKGRLIGTLNGVGAAALAALGASPTTGQVDAVYAKYGVTYAYDDADRMISMTEADGANGAGNRTLYYYDADGRLTYQINALGEIVQFGYDSFGERTDLTLYGTRIASGTLSGLTGGTITSGLTGAITANSAVDSHSQTAFGRTGSVAQTTDALGAATSYAYDAFGDLTSRTDPLGGGVTRLTSLSYDRRGLLSGSILDAASGGLQLTSAYGYDAFGRLLQTTDPAGVVRASTYDRAGRTLTTTDGLSQSSTYTYDGRGALLTATDRTGKTTTYAYTAFDRRVTVTTSEGVVTTTNLNAFGQTVSVTDGAGRTTSWTYDADGHVTRVTDGAGNHADSAYDFDGRLASVTDARGIVTTYGYDAANRRLSQTVDPTGLNLTTAYQYDAKGQAVQVTDPAGVVTPVAFDLNGRKTSVVTDPGGLALATTYAYDRSGRVLTLTEASGTGAQKVTKYVYDKAGRLTSTQVDPTGLNLTTGYTYDADGNAVARTDANGLVTRYVYDAENRLIYAVDPAGDVVKTSYDGEGRLTARLAYVNPISSSTLSGLPLAITASQVTSNLTPSSGSDQLTAFAYDGDGRLRYEVGATGLVCQYDYDGAGNVLQKTEYAGAIATASSYSQTYVSGQISSLNLASNGANRITRNVFDNANRAAFGIDADGEVTGFSYDAAGHVVKTVQYADRYTTSGVQTLATLQTWATSHAAVAANRVSRTVYDAAGRAVYGVDGEGYVTEQQYDAAGHITGKIRYAAVYTVADGATQASVKALLPSSPPSSSVTAYYAYDHAGRLTDLTDGLGVVTHLALDAMGQVIDSTVAYGTGDAAATHNTYDAAGRLASQTLGYGAAEASTSAWTYDGLGRVLTATDGDGRVTTNSYDAAGRLHIVYAPFNGGSYAVTVNGYDAFGNLVSVTDPRGNSGYFYYDRLNRQVLQVDPEGYLTATAYSRGDQVATVTRYAVKATGSWSATSQPSVTTNAKDATTSFTRDRLDRVTAVTDAGGYSETYVLNAFGDRTSVTNKLGGVTTNSFDHRGLLVSEVLPINSVRANGTVEATSVTNTYAYNARGKLTQKNEAVGLADHRTTSYTYDRLDRVLTVQGDDIVVTAQDLVTTATVTPTQFTYYDARGNVIESKDTNLARTLYFYDQLNRKVAQVDPLGTLTTWAYDDANNALSMRVYADPVTLPSSAGGAPPAPTGSGAYRQTLYGYDLANNLVSTTVQNVRTGAWDGTAFQTVQADVTATAAYDASGHVIRQTDGAGHSSYFFYDSRGQQIAQVDADNYLTSYTRDAEGNVTKEERFATRLSGAVTTASDPATLRSSVSGNAADRITEFTYDKNGQRLTETRKAVAYATVDANGTLTPNLTGDATVSYTYNGLGEVTRKTEATGDYTVYAYDLGGRQTTETDAVISNYFSIPEQKLTEYFYDGLGAVTRTQIGNIPHTNTRVTTYAYNVGGRLASMTDATGFTKTYGYDAVGHVVAEFYTRTTNSSSVQEANAYRYDAAGRVIFQAVATKTGATWDFGLDTQIRYDAFGEVTGKGVGGAFQETWEYDNAGQMWRSTAGDGVTRAYMYDAAGHQTLMVQTAGSGPLEVADMDELVDYLTVSGAQTIGAGAVGGLVVTISDVDARGQTLGVLEPFRNSDLTFANTTNIEHHKTYDAFGEVLTETDARGNATTYAYNALGKLVQTTLPAVAITGEDGLTVTASPVTKAYYDLSGRLIATRDANAVVSTRKLLAGSGYGGTEALATIEYHADGGRVETGYNVFQNAITYTDEMNNTEVRAYDAMDRLVTVTHPSTSTDFRLIGTSAAETFDAKGAAFIEGKGGADTYVYNPGYGFLEIKSDAGFPTTNTSVLQLGGGLTAGDIKVIRTAEGDMILTDGVLGDQIKIDGMFNDYSGYTEYGVARVDFTAGGSLTRAQLIAMAVTGSADNPYLVGSNGAETLDGLGISHYAQGGAGADVYVFNSGYGYLEIQADTGDVMNATSLIRFGAGIAAGDLSVTRGPNGDMMIAVGTGGDLIRIVGMFNDYSGYAKFGVGSVTFAGGGGGLSRAQLIALAMTGRADNTILTGSNGADTIDGAGFAHFVAGGAGADIYKYDAGDGLVEIKADTNGASNTTATISLGAGLTAGSLTVIRLQNGDMEITDGVTGDLIRIDGMFNDYYGYTRYGVAQINFAGGGSLTRAQLIALTTTGSSTNTMLIGASGADTLDGGGYAHYAAGGTGADVYRYDSGDGVFEINADTGGNTTTTATLNLGGGLTASNLTVFRTNNGDMILGDGVTGDEIRLDGMFNDWNGYARWGVASVTFAAGGSLTRQQLINLSTTGSATNKTLIGSNGADTIDSGGYAHYAQGFAGADSYIFNSGYGYLEINADAGNYTTTTSVLRLGTGLTLAALSVYRTLNGDMLLTDGVSGDLIKLDNEFNDYYGTAHFGVGSVVFADGTTRTRAQLMAMATTPSTSTLTGTSGADTLTAAATYTTLQGNGGADVFVYAPGDKEVAIASDSGFYLTNNSSILKIGGGLTAANLTVTSDSAGNLIISFGAGAPRDRITISQQLNYGGAYRYGVSSIEFDDTSTLSRAQLRTLATNGSSGEPALYGDNGVDTLDSQGIAKLVVGRGDADTFIYNPGYGALEISQDSGFYTTATTSVLRIGGGLVASDLKVSSDAAGNLYIATGVAGDLIKIDQQLNASPAYRYGVATVLFDDASTLTGAQLAALAFANTGDAPAVYGSQGVDTLDSGGVANLAVGRGGNDTYIYNPGYHQLEIISDSGYSLTNGSVLRIGGGLTASDLIVTSDIDGNLFVRDGVVGDLIKIDQQLNKPNNFQFGVDSVVFDNGSTLTRAQLTAKAVDGANGAVALYGSQVGETIDSKGVSNLVVGRGGVDTYIYNPGYHQLEINGDVGYYATSNSILRIGGGLTAANLRVRGDIDGNLYITDGTAGDLIKIDYQLNKPNNFEYGVGSVVFDNGTSLTRDQLAAMATTGTTDRPVLYGSQVNDTFDSLGLSTLVVGRGGVDTFIYGEGYGQLEINEDNGYYAASNSVLRFSAGIVLAQIGVTSDSNGNLYITDGIAGDRIKLTNQLNKPNVYEYGVNSVVFADGTTLTRAQLAAMADGGASLVDHYSYDGLGQRLTHWNNQFGASIKETADYDNLGRVIRTTDFDNHATTITYTYDAALTTTGMTTGGVDNVYGGWTKTTNTADHAMWTKTDYFGRVVESSDLGGHLASMTYDQAGRLAMQTSNVGQNLQYAYYSTGLLAVTEDQVTASGAVPRDVISQYTYDQDGNRLTENYYGVYTYYDWSTGPYSTTQFYQQASVTWDALNRMTHFEDLGENGTRPATVDYQYDANSNVRHVAASFQDLTSGGTNTSQDSWYTYDALNRIKTTEGQLVDSFGVATTVGAAGNTIVRGATGTDLAYNLAGQRTRAGAGVGAGSLELYGYNPDGTLATVSRDGALESVDVRDRMGRITSHREFSPLGATVFSRTSTYANNSDLTDDITTTLIQSDSSIVTSTTHYDYKAPSGGGAYNGNYQGGVVIHSQTSNTKLLGATLTNLPTSATTNGYDWWQSAQINESDYKADISTGTAPNTSIYTYDADGKLVSVKITDGRPRTVNFVTDAAGQVLSRQETSSASSNPKQFYYDFNGVRVGEIGNNGPGQATPYAAAIAARGAAAASGAFASGSASAYSNFSQSYDPINPSSSGETGASSDYTVRDGDTLQSIASVLWGDSSLWWLIADANGLSNTQQLTAGATLTIPAKVTNIHNTSATFKVYDPNQALGDLQPNQVAPPKNSHGCGALGIILAVVVAVVVFTITHDIITTSKVFLAITETAGPVVVAAAEAAALAASGAVANAASQGVMIATGNQDKFSWKQVGIAAISAGLSGGVDPNATIWEAAAQAVRSNVIAQGVSIAVGLQHKFDWTAVAVSAVAGGVSHEVGSALDKNFNLPVETGTVRGTINAAISSSAAVIAAAATRSLIQGTDFGDNLKASLPDVLAATLGNAIARRQIILPADEPVSVLSIEPANTPIMNAEFVPYPSPVFDDVADWGAPLSAGGDQFTLEKPMATGNSGVASSMMALSSDLEPARKYIAEHGTSWASSPPKTPNSAPDTIDLTALAPAFDKMMAGSYPNGVDLEDGAAIFGNSKGELKLGNIHGLLRDPNGGRFIPDLSSEKFLDAIPTDFSTKGEFHTHPYTTQQDGGNYSVTFSGTDVAQLINSGLNFSVVQSQSNQWLLLRTAQSPAPVANVSAANRFAQAAETYASNQNSSYQAAGKSFEEAQFLTIKSMAKQYNLVLYQGSQGVFKRVK